MNITELLYDVTEDERVFDPKCELIDSGILDSLAMIRLVEELEDNGYELVLTRIDKKCLSTPASIKGMIEERM